MYFLFFYLLIFFNNSKSFEASVPQNKVHFPPVTYYYTNILLLNLFNSTDIPTETFKNEVNKILRHSDYCKNLFEVIINEQHTNTWKDIDENLLSKLLLSMIETINNHPENINIEQIRSDIASNSSKSSAELVKSLDKNTKTCKILFGKWLTFENMSLDHVWDESLFSNFFVSMRVLNEKIKHLNIIDNLTTNTNYSTDSINIELNKVFSYLKNCEILFDIILKLENSVIHKDYDDKLSITRFLISMIKLNKNMEKNVEIKMNGLYRLDNVDFEKDIINPIFFLDQVHMPKIEDSNMSPFNLSKTLKIVSIIHKKIKEQKVRECNNSLSSNQLLYSLYNCISLTAFNSYSMIFQAYKVYSSIVSEISSQVVESKRRQLMKTMLMIANQSTVAMENQSQIIYRCDPNILQEGDNFERLQNFIYTDVLGLDYINNNYINKSLPYKSCEDLPKDVSSLSCTGNIRDCKTRIEKRKIFGTTSIINYSPSLENNISVCTCFCDDFKNPNTIRNISLQEVCAKNDQGVVTGVKFGIERGVIVLKIRVGILDNHVVDPKKQDWNSTYVSIKNPGSIQSNWSREKNNSDIQNEHSFESFALSYDNRSVLLGDTVTPPGTVIQGVRFAICKEGVSIDVLASKIDDNGRVLSATAKWYTSCDKKIKRYEVQIPTDSSLPMNPELQESQNNVIRKSDAFVKFQATAWKPDLIQTTIPFFDTQEVITNPPVPLSGLGILFKKHEKYGGSLGLYLSTFDFTYFMTQNYITKNIEKLLEIPQKKWFN